MTTLHTLFPEGPPRRAAAIRSVDDELSRHRLAQMVGAPMPGSLRTVRTDVRRLVAMVDEASRTAGLAERPSLAGGGQSGRRRRRRIDVLTAGAAILAVVAVSVAGVLGGMRAASASPAEDSLRILDSYEAELVNLEVLLRGEPAALAEQVEQAAVGLVEVREALAATRQVSDPRTAAGPDAPPLPLVDGAALDAVLVEMDAQIALLGEVVVPTAPPRYARGALDESSLPAVAEAIDRARAAISDLDEYSAALRAVRETVSSVTTTALTALAGFTDRFTAAAQAAVSRNTDATEATRGALSDAAAALVASRLAPGAATTVLSGYRAAFVALVIDQERAVREAAEAAERARLEALWRQQQNQQPTDPTEPGGGDDDPGDPSEPEG